MLKVAVVALDDFFDLTQSNQLTYHSLEILRVTNIVKTLFTVSMPSIIYYHYIFYYFYYIIIM